MKFKIALIVICTLFLMSCGSHRKVRTTSSKKPAKKTNVATKSKINKNELEKLEATSFVVVTFENVEEYISWFKNTAISNMINYKIPASITLAQGILESGAGKGELCKKANNHFGIKCHVGWEGASVHHDDDEAQECFRKYNHPAESYRDHSLFLTSRDRYKSLFKLKGNDYKGWAQGLKDAGYATDPKYPAKLIAIIERYQLYRFDAETLGISNDDVVYEAPKKAISNSEYEVIKGDTLYSISRKHNISVDDLKSKNNISDNAISIGQILKIK
ncbi:glucosaminidase domain-containing protein [uncultured Flavobacterium sp.]|uniref:glucosaminidase domain-containing protein n=1 Tax=uncultured Flavobacterium sp. TaxID=165435 RepID=UPI0030ECFE66|tara:strand:+ start:8056 stop:8877 length:822 start_codon:yes stop_codon:yes gene_type:complete